MADSPSNKSPGSPAPRSESERIEDTGSKALSDALHSSFTIIKVVMVGLAVVFLSSGLRIVNPQEKAVILRFGKPVGTGEDALLGPGAHWAFPYPIDEIVRIPVGQVQSIQSTIGWYATTAAMEAAGTEPPADRTLKPGRDGYVLTADENIVHIRGTLQYRISEPGLRFAFGFANASNTVQDAFNNAIIHSAARMKVDDILTQDVAGFRERVVARINQLIGILQLGVIVDQVAIQAIPPRQVAQPFEEVLTSRITANRTINDAKSFSSKTLSQAAARAKAIRSSGESDRKQLVEFVGAEARRFNELLPSFEHNRDLFTRQLRTEVLRTILTNAQEKFLLPSGAGDAVNEWRIHINRKPQRVEGLTQPVAPEEDPH